MTDAPELLPCPFCGGEAETTLGPVPGKWGARCKVCDVWRDDREPNKAKAIAAWNTRAPDPRVAALVEAATEVSERIAPSDRLSWTLEQPVRRLDAALAAFKGDDNG